MSEKKKSFNDFYEIKVKDIMQTTKSELPCVDERADTTHVFSILQSKDHIWVLDSLESQRLVGVISESDTLMFLSPPITSLQSFDKPDPRSMQYGIPITAEEIMSKNPVTIPPDETIRDVLLRMREQNVKQLAVVDEHKILIGEITIHQLITRYHEDFNTNETLGSDEKNSENQNL